ncbi:hypothetical protein K8R42_04170 [bacterium]|nr:hypothetical protein [bacterium]
MSDSRNHGRLFIILEVPKHKIDQQPFVDEIINETASFFDTTGTDDPETLLEELLQHINQILPELSSSIKIRSWISHLDLAIGIMYQNNVYVASIGNLNGVLVHNNQITQILSKNTNISPTKAFSDIISGQLDDGDVLMISTNSLFDYISKEKIKQIVKKYSPSAAAIKINELLESVPDFVSFNSLIIKKPGLVDMEIKPSQIPIDGQAEFDIKTDTVDTGPKIHAKKRPKGAKTKLVIDFKAFKNIKTVAKGSQILSLAGLFFSIVKNIFVYIFAKIKKAFLFLTSSKYRKGREDKALDDIKGITDKKYYWFRNLTVKKKMAVVVLFIVLLFFVQGLVFLTQQKAGDDKNKTFNEALVSVEAKYTDVEAKLIYNDEQAAETLLLEIDDIVKNLQANSPQQEEQVEQMKEKVFRELNKIRHIHVVPAPLELSDLSDILTNSQDIVQKDGIFYILGDNKLFELKDEILTEVFNFAGSPGGEPASTATQGGQVVNSMTDWPEKNKVVLNTLSANEEIHYQIFDLDQKKISGDLKQATDNTSVSDLVIYGNNLYVLDTENNQIFKYPESGSSFANGVRWIKEEMDITDGSSLTIDGSIYIIANDGQIKNLLKGANEEYKYHQPNPAIGSGASIKTFRDSDYLYIIDPQNYRIVILDKEGNIKDQYTSMKFDALRDLAVDPDEKAVYLLNGNHLYLLAIN